VAWLVKIGLLKVLEQKNPKLQAPNYKRFDKLTTLSKVDGQISNFYPVESCLRQVRQRRNSTGQPFNDRNKNSFVVSDSGHCDLFDICDL
jgi:hypothetical protein